MTSRIHPSQDDANLTKTALAVAWRIALSRNDDRLRCDAAPIMLNTSNLQKVSALDNILDGSAHGSRPINIV